MVSVLLLLRVTSCHRKMGGSAFCLSPLPPDRGRRGGPQRACAALRCPTLCGLDAGARMRMPCSPPTQTTPRPARCARSSEGEQQPRRMQTCLVTCNAGAELPPHACTLDATSTRRYCAVLCCAVLCCAVLCRAVRYCAVPHGTVLACDLPPRPRHSCHRPLRCSPTATPDCRPSSCNHSKHPPRPRTAIQSCSPPPQSQSFPPYPSCFVAGHRLAASLPSPPLYPPQPPPVCALTPLLFRCFSVSVSVSVSVSFSFHLPARSSHLRSPPAQLNPSSRSSLLFFFLLLLSSPLLVLLLFLSSPSPLARRARPWLLHTSLLHYTPRLPVRLLFHALAIAFLRSTHFFAVPQQSHTLRIFSSFPFLVAPRLAL